MRPSPAEPHPNTHRPLTPRFDRSVGRLADERQIASQQIGTIDHQLPQSAVDGGHFLAGIEDVGGVHSRRRMTGGRIEHDGEAALHVGGADAPEDVAVDSCTIVPVGRNGVGVPCEDHTMRAAEIGPRGRGCRRSW